MKAFCNSQQCLVLQAAHTMWQFLKAEMLEHLPYILDLVLSDYHLIGSLKEHFCDTKFSNDQEESMEAVLGSFMIAVAQKKMTALTYNINKLEIWRDLVVVSSVQTRKRDIGYRMNTLHENRIGGRDIINDTLTCTAGAQFSTTKCHSENTLYCYMTSSNNVFPGRCTGVLVALFVFMF